MWESFNEWKTRNRYRGSSAHAGWIVQRIAEQRCGTLSRAGGHSGCHGTCRGKTGRCLGSHTWSDPDGCSGSEPCTAGIYRRRHSRRSSGMGHEPALRLRFARGRPWRPADRRRLEQCGRRRRSGKHEPGSTLFTPAQWRQNGRHRAGRQHDQGWPVGRLQRLSHGQHR